jgi:hypothetical protein
MVLIANKTGKAFYLGQVVFKSRAHRHGRGGIKKLLVLAPVFFYKHAVNAVALV